MHFTALVIGEDIDGQLAPFMQNCCAEPEKRFMEFYDVEDVMLDQYENQSEKRIIEVDGMLLIPLGTGEPFAPHPTTEHLEKRIIPYKEKYATFEDFARHVYGFDKRDETYNRYGCWQNPNARWDWYSIGGRWTGFFKLKKGRKAILGPLAFSPKAVPDDSRADQAQKEDIDFDQMRNEAERRAIEKYDAVQEAIKDTPPNETLEVITTAMSR